MENEENTNLEHILNVLAEKKYVNWSLLKSELGSASQASSMLSLLQEKKFIQFDEENEEWVLNFKQITQYMEKHPNSNKDSRPVLTAVDSQNEQPKKSNMDRVIFIIIFVISMGILKGIVRPTVRNAVKHSNIVATSNSNATKNIKNEGTPSQNFSNNEIEKAKNVIQSIKENDEFIAILLEKDKTFENSFSKDIQHLLKNYPTISNISLDDMEYKIGLFPSVENASLKYLLNTSNEALYQQLKTEYNMMKKYNCSIITSIKDRQNSNTTKKKVVLDAIQQPYKGALLSDKEMEQIYFNIRKYYKQNGYKVDDLDIALGGKQVSISPQENCKVMIRYYEGLLNLPQEQAIAFQRRFAHEALYE